jgi:capsular polysaccharide transport system ATP-binding protein
MIIFDRVTKKFKTGGADKIIARDVSLTIPKGSRVGLLGRNGAGKSTLLNMISGMTRPNKGRIIKKYSVSWPLGFAGSFHPALTGAQNVVFVARIYGRDTAELTEYVKEFAQLGDYFYMPVQSYSSGMRARLAFGVSMGISFDCYLVDEITAVGDTNFRKKAANIFNDRLSKSDVIMVSHSTGTIFEYCNCGIIMENGEFKFYEDIKEAVEVHEKNMAK